MGTFRVAIDIGNPTGTRWHSVDALVDPDASYTVVPRAILAALNVEATARWPFDFADGREAELNIEHTIHPSPPSDCGRMRRSAAREWRTRRPSSGRGCWSPRGNSVA
jgi:hypothetical protein